MTTETTYIERADAMSAEAKGALTKELERKFALFKKHAAAGQSAVLSGVNVAREIGEAIRGITGHEKLLASEFNQLALALPDTGINFAKECLSIYNGTPKPVTDYAAAKPIWDRLLTQLELLPKSRRETAAEQTPKLEPVEEFLCSVSSLASQFIKLERVAPVEKWKPYYRSTFCFEFARLSAIHDRIKQLPIDV